MILIIHARMSPSGTHQPVIPEIFCRGSSSYSTLFSNMLICPASLPFAFFLFSLPLHLVPFVRVRLASSMPAVAGKVQEFLGPLFFKGLCLEPTSRFRPFGTGSAFPGGRGASFILTKALENVRKAVQRGVAQLGSALALGRLLARCLPCSNHSN